MPFKALYALLERIAVALESLARQRHLAPSSGSFRASYDDWEKDESWVDNVDSEKVANLDARVEEWKRRGMPLSDELPPGPVRPDGSAW